ncbi:MAG: response regulator [Flavobacterium sp.]|nr:MAG: response regulator [Flavobacterium sp.]
MNSETKINILYIDDEIFNLTAFLGTFRRHYNVYTCITIAEGYEVLQRFSIDIVICDYHVSSDDGISFFKSITVDYPGPIRILSTGYAEKEVIEDAIKSGYIYKCIAKPWTVEKLRSDIEKAYHYLKMNS